MTYQTIDDIPTTATSVTGADKIEVRQSGTTKKSTLTTLLAYIQSALTFPTSSVTPTNYTSTTRALNTVYQNTTGKPLEVTATVEMATTLSLSGGQTSNATFLSDASNPPTTVRPATKNGNTGTLTIGLNITQTIDVPLTYTVPNGHYYKVATSGTGTVTWVGWTENLRS